VLHVAALPEQQAEDLMTSTYMRDTAIGAGLTTEALLVADIGWDPDAPRVRRPAAARDHSRSSSSIPGSGWCGRSSARTRSTPTSGAVDRADLEDALVEQGDPGGAMGALPEPPEPRPRLSRCAARSDVVREEAEE